MNGEETRAAGILRYLASCYRENGSRTGLFHLNSSRIHGHLFFEGEDEIVSQATLDGQVFVPGRKAAELAAKARLYEKDRELIYGSVFLAGRWEGSDTARTRRDTVFAPLLLYGVSVSQVMEDNGGAEFLIDTSRSTLNFSLLEHLGDDEFVTRLEEAVDRSGHSEACVSELQRVLQAQVPDLDVTPLRFYPRLLGKRSLQEYLREDSQNQTGLSLVSGAVLFLGEKSTEMRGVLNDLEEIAVRPGQLSAPVRALFGFQENERAKMGKETFGGQLPAILSPAQEAVLKSSREYPITLAVGPPGTGKSFTIASLAIEAMSRGESVLIVSKMDHAVDVVADKIEQGLELEGVCVRAGRKAYLAQLKKFIENLLCGLYSWTSVSRKQLAQDARELRRICDRVERLEYFLEKRFRAAEKAGEILSHPNPGWFTRWKQASIRRRASKDRLSLGIALQMGHLLDERTARTVAHLKKVRGYYLRKALKLYRPTFQAFSKGIRARTSHKKEEYFEGVDWNGLLSALPIWLSKLSDLHRILPMKNELFDLVIIDEASQCDIASAFPALARARRAIVTGDPKQLRHISFLPTSRQRDFAIQEGLSTEDAEQFHFRRVSLVDLLSDRIERQDQVHFLNEHFRSRPEIIAFSNEVFYDNRLAVMTGHRDVDRHGGQALQRFEVNGQRTKAGVNHLEVDEVLLQLEKLSEVEPPLSIGILSPFRAQVEEFQKRIEMNPRAMALLEKNSLLIGTAHSFQGEERDVMLLSLALDNESPSASYRFLQREDVFNVAITRARLENRIFTSFSSLQRGEGLLGRYLSYVEAESEWEKVGRSEEDRSQGTSISEAFQSLIDGLSEAGCEVKINFEIGGYRVDLLCSQGSRSLGVDVVGFPGAHSEALSLDRHLALRRAGISLFPVGLAEWEVKGNEILQEISKKLMGTSTGGT